MRSPSQTPKEPHLSLAGLKARGWTPSLITRFLGEPDRLATNPHARSAAPMKLYRAARVESAEARAEFRAAQSAASMRQARGRDVAARKHAELVQQAEGLAIDLTVVPLDELQRRAIAHYNARGPRRDDDWSWTPATAASDRAFLERIMVNYARHQLTHYDRELDALYARVGVDAASSVIRRRVYARIAEAWPTLADECARQNAARASA